MDTVPANVRSRMMSAVRTKNTAPELQVRRTLHALGFRYRLHERRLPGCPDIVFPRFRVAVFVHGCFWHGHRCRRGRRPISNAAFWNGKIESNRERDRRNIAALRNSGWKVVVIWACSLDRKLPNLIAELQSLRSVFKSN
jgi:DNA mismatch endonuclease (patch repair protein)